MPGIVCTQRRASVYVRSLRLAGELTQNEVARRLKMHQAHLSRIERGQRSASAEVIAQISNAIISIVEERYRAVHELTS